MNVNTGQARASWSPERQRCAWVVGLAACWTRCVKGVDMNSKNQLLFFFSTRQYFIQWPGLAWNSLYSLEWLQIHNNPPASAFLKSCWYKHHAGLQRLLSTRYGHYGSKHPELCVSSMFYNKPGPRAQHWGLMVTWRRERGRDRACPKAEGSCAGAT